MKYIYLTLCLLIISCSKPSKESNNQDVFNSLLVGELYKLKEIKEKNNSLSNTILSVVLSDKNFYNSTGQCNIITALTLSVDTLKISGYTYIDNEFVACYILSDSCNIHFINKENLFTHKDIITKYANLNYPIADGNYDFPTYLYRIVNKDSIVLVYPTVD